MNPPISEEELERKRLLYKAQNEVLITEEREDQFRESMKELNKLTH